MVLRLECRVVVNPRLCLRRCAFIISSSRLAHQLRRLLRTYAMFDTELCYVQGMSYHAAVLALVVGCGSDTQLDLRGSVSTACTLSHCARAHNPSYDHM